MSDGVFDYKGHEPDDWCMLHGQIIWNYAKELGCVLGRARPNGIFAATTRAKHVFFIRRCDYDAIQTLRKIADPKCVDMVMLGPGAFIFPGDHSKIEELSDD